MKTITLTQGKVAFVDDEDFERLNQFKWNTKNYKDKFFYAARNIVLPDGKRTTITMHRDVLEIIDPAIIIDHRDHNGLNNQRHNIRRCTRQDNQYNQKKRPGTSSYKGVCFNRFVNQWHAQIAANKKHMHIGLFSTEHEAAYAYDVAALKYHKEFAHTNVPLLKIEADLLSIIDTFPNMVQSIGVKL